MSAVNKEVLKNPLPTVLSLLDTVLSSTREGAKYEGRKRSAKFKFTSDLIFDHLEGISKNSRDIKRLCLEQNVTKLNQMDETSDESRVSKDGTPFVKEESQQNRKQQKKEQRKTSKEEAQVKQHQASLKKRRKQMQQIPQQLKQSPLEKTDVKVATQDDAHTKNDSKGKKDSSPGFSIDNILGNHERTDVASKKDDASEFDKQNRLSDRRLPNISQFFQPIEERVSFNDSSHLDRTSIASMRCGMSATTTSSNALMRNGAFIASLDDSFPLLRNAGKLEFHPASINQTTLHQSPVTLKLESKENKTVKEDKPDNKSRSEHYRWANAEPTAAVEGGKTGSTSQVNSGGNGNTNSSRGYKCEKCGKIYCRKYVLKIHMRTHTGDKPLKCEICGKSFSDPSNMKKHIKLHETDHVTYPCKFCGRNFVRRRGLLNHLHSMHSRFPFTQSQ